MPPQRWSFLVRQRHFLVALTSGAYAACGDKLNSDASGPKVCERSELPMPTEGPPWTIESRIAQEVKRVTFR